MIIDNGFYMIQVTHIITMLTSSPEKSPDTACPGATFPSPLCAILKERERKTFWSNEKQSKSTENFLYLHAVVMCTYVSFVLCRVSVFIRRQQLAPKFPIGCLGSCQVHRKAQRISNAFKGTIKDAPYFHCSNSRHI